MENAFLQAAYVLLTAHERTWAIVGRGPMWAVGQCGPWANGLGQLAATRCPLPRATSSCHHPTSGPARHNCRVLQGSKAQGSTQKDPNFWSRNQAVVGITTENFSPEFQQSVVEDNWAVLSAHALRCRDLPEVFSGSHRQIS